MVLRCSYLIKDRLGRWLLVSDSDVVTNDIGRFSIAAIRSTRWSNESHSPYAPPLSHCTMPML
jgi:hypothetical protein